MTAVVPSLWCARCVCGRYFCRKQTTFGGGKLLEKSENMKLHAAAVLTLMVLPSRGERKSSFEVRVSGKYSSLGHDSLMREPPAFLPYSVTRFPCF